MKFTIVEKLGDVVGFGKTEIKILRNIWDKIPEVFHEDFKVLAEQACDYYYSVYEKQKTEGLNPKPLTIKKEAIDKFITPFLNKNGVEKTISKSVIRPKKPRIPDESERIRITPDGATQRPMTEGMGSRDALIDDVEIDEEEISLIFDTYSAEELSDELPDTASQTDVSEVSDLFEEGEEFDFEALLNS